MSDILARALSGFEVWLRRSRVMQLSIFPLTMLRAILTKAVLLSYVRCWRIRRSMFRLAWTLVAPTNLPSYDR